MEKINKNQNNKVLGKSEGHMPKHSDNRTILVMDDEEMIRETISYMLKSFGYAVITAVDGHEAIHLFRQRAESGGFFAAVILDLTIPYGLGGKETIKKLRKLDKNVPALVISGYADDPVIIDCEKYGFNGRIRKPFTRSELGEMLGRLIKKNSI
jgi:two-component system, cell cycle sensor histidine kinase and response regulator CckA